jgi:hypothetical protein
MVKGVCDLGAQFRRLTNRKPPGRQTVSKRHAFDEVADDEYCVQLAADFMNADDARMPQLSRRSGLAQELLGFVQVKLPLAWNLDGDHPVKFLVPRLPD